ncbi:MAG TPA: NAD(P)-dependent oxidoreductase [Chitinophagales bacterium]|nr:NAD(P)-dependent oxidoreductase [Chitinophagales bacterium]
MTILVTDHIHLSFFKELEGSSFEIDYRPEIDQHGIMEIISDFDGVIINSKSMADKALIDKGRKLKFIARMGSGMEIIDVAYAEQRGIACINSPEGNRDAVAEHATGMLLCLMNHIHTADAEVRNLHWERETNRGNEISGKTIGIYGYGNTGSAFAKRLSGFDVTVMAYDKYKTGFGGNHVRESTPEEIFEKAEVLSLHLPLTPETKYLVDYTFLSGFKNRIWLVNTARGQHIRTADLLKAIREGKVLGAALDVLENEKIDRLSSEEKKWFDELAKEKRVLLTPHIAGVTKESKEKIARILAAKIKMLFS